MGIIKVVLFESILFEFSIRILRCILRNKRREIGTADKKLDRQGPVWSLPFFVSKKWEAVQEGPQGRSANCGNGLFAQCVRPRLEINRKATTPIVGLKQFTKYNPEPTPQNLSLIEMKTTALPC